MIDFGRKPGGSATEVAPPKKDEPYYPSVSIDSDSPIKFPKGEFMARVKMKMRNSTASTDERGKERHSYSLSVCGMHPGFEGCKESDDEDEMEDAEPDAAESLMQAMGRARDKKFISADTD